MRLFLVCAVLISWAGIAQSQSSDPIVRVQANKLRMRLKAYYAGRSATTPVQIEIPKGAYVPAFREHQAPHPGRRNRLRLNVLAALAALLVAAVLLSWRFGPLRRSVKASIPWRLTFDTGWNSHPAVSRDGSLLAFASDRPDGGNIDIWVCDLRGEMLRRLTTHPAIDQTPDFSPDGRRIVFRSFRSGGGIYSIPVAGGPETLIAAGGSARLIACGRLSVGLSQCWLHCKLGRLTNGRRLSACATNGSSQSRS